ncbi:MAG: hypothetical protein QXG39_04735 [Candidatus Aenigmatarchaeota archaeon]
MVKIKFEVLGILLGIILATLIFFPLVQKTLLTQKCASICKPYKIELVNKTCFCVLEIEGEKVKVKPSSWESG